VEQNPLIENEHLQYIYYYKVAAIMYAGYPSAAINFAKTHCFLLLYDFHYTYTNFIFTWLKLRLRYLRFSVQTITTTGEKVSCELLTVAKTGDGFLYRLFR